MACGPIPPFHIFLGQKRPPVAMVFPNGIIADSFFREFIFLATLCVSMKAPPPHHHHKHLGTHWVRPSRGEQPARGRDFAAHIARRGRPAPFPDSVRRGHRPRKTGVSPIGVCSQTSGKCIARCSLLNRTGDMAEYETHVLTIYFAALSLVCRGLSLVSMWPE